MKNMSREVVFLITFICVQTIVVGEKSKLSVTGSDMRGVLTSLGNMLVDYERKFAFCPIQKAGSSLWTQLFLRMKGEEYWYIY